MYDRQQHRRLDCYLFGTLPRTVGSWPCTASTGQPYILPWLHHLTFALSCLALGVPCCVPSAVDAAVVQAGQGLYFESTTGTYRARNCDRGSGTEGEFGVSNRTYGLSPSACR